MSDLPYPIGSTAYVYDKQLRRAIPVIIESYIIGRTGTIVEYSFQAGDERFSVHSRLSFLSATEDEAIKGGQA